MGHRPRSSLMPEASFPSFPQDRFLCHWGPSLTVTLRGPSLTIQLKQPPGPLTSTLVHVLALEHELYKVKYHDGFGFLMILHAQPCTCHIAPTPWWAKKKWINGWAMIQVPEEKRTRPWVSTLHLPSAWLGLPDFTSTLWISVSSYVKWGESSNLPHPMINVRFWLDTTYEAHGVLRSEWSIKTSSCL